MFTAMLLLRSGAERIEASTRKEMQMAIAFERATEIVAQRLASFRLGLDADDPFAYNDREKLCAGHIVGSLWANGLLNTGDEKWESVASEKNDTPPVEE